MAITLSPTPAQLGIMAPVLGPWFSDATVELPALDPAGKLGLTVTLPGLTDWFAPATGTMGLFVTDSAKPPLALDALQDADGAWPFPDGRIVAFFRLLPEVEARLHALTGLIPPATANAVDDAPTVIAAPSRPQVRSFAILLPQDVPLTPAGIYAFMGSNIGDPAATDADKMAALGLALDEDTGTISNGEVPMTWLRRPGGAQGTRDVLLQGLTQSIELWAFDRRGRAIDPGAVACWWSWLLNTAVGDDANFQLVAPDISALLEYPDQDGLPAVVRFAPQRTAHLVDAHEGPLGAPFLDARLELDGATADSNLVLLSDDASATLSFSALEDPDVDPTDDNPQIDDAPRPRLAVLPTGDYGDSAVLWPDGPVHEGLTRDFVRVAVVEEESHLTGVTRRDSREAVTNPDERRRSAQNRPSTRINVNRTVGAGSVLLANSQLVANAILGLSNATAPTRMVLGLADAAWGGTPSVAPPIPGPGPLPNALRDAGAATIPAVGQYRVRALTGGGASAADNQTVLVEINLGAASAGAWVRAWPLGFNLETGLHFRLTGGAGRANANGVAQLPMLLANGLLGAGGLMGMDTLVLLPGATPPLRSYADCRFERPTPVGGAPAAVAAGTWVVCETGESASGALTAGAVPPGGHVILLGATPAILDRSAIPAAALDANTLANALQPTDIVSLTAPAFAATPDRAAASGHPLPRTPAGGDPTGGLAAIVGARLHRLDRGLLAGATASSVPYALLDRLEVAAATTPQDAEAAVIGGSPPVPWALEPATEFFLGHPEVPAAIEIHGTGAALTGAPAIAVAEYTRERTAGLAFPEVRALAEPLRSAAVQGELALAAEAATPLPEIADDATPGPVAAVLRTVAFGVEGIPGVGVGATAANIFPLSQQVAAFEAWLDDNVPIAGGAGAALRGRIGGPTDSIARALDRRILTSAFGAREGLTALLAAIDRAQDLIYLETPAVDALAIDSGGENLRPWQRILDRMNARKGLRLVLCVPTLLGPGTPRQLQAIRDQGLMDAVDAIRAAAGDRFALFAPGAGAGRAVRFASTSVVVDDVFALTGTTHLWRRGLTWDSSLAAAVFDERLIDGRPLDVRAFRIQLLADRLGIETSRLPEDPAELVKAIRDLDARGSNRLSVTPIIRPETVATAADFDTWNPDGSKSGLSLGSIAALFAAAVALTGVDHAIIEG